MKKRIHFIGIGGSGMSGVALMAQAAGYEISGCDLNLEASYLENIKKLKIPLYLGQDINHIKNADIVAVTPAVFFQNENHPEVVLAKKGKKLVTWQKFLGKYLQKDRKVICIAGTHGKSTTTALLSLLLEKAKMDPSVMVGATVKEWNANYRVGNLHPQADENFFVTEADEFFDNFLNYSPEIIILNNIEFDHPDYFKTINDMYESFKKFVLSLKGKKILIYNKDSVGIRHLFKLIDEKKLAKLKLYGYTLKGKNIILSKDRTNFEVDGEKYSLKIAGKYNVSNALGVISLAKLLNIPTEIIRETLENFNGIGRRLELIGEKNNIKIYDDYAHHPTAIKETLKALRQKYPDEKILAIIEPHTFSRTKALLPFYKNAFVNANEAIITPIFRSRDSEDYGISGTSIVRASRAKNVKFLDSFDKIISYAKENKKNFDVIIVMGAGNSSDLAKDIFKKI